MFKELKGFQVTAVNNLINQTSMLLDKEGTKKVCVFCSPTGSGKTIMTAKFIEGIIKRREDEICFVWITIGKGDLHVQSRNSLRRIFSGNPKVSLLENDFQGGRSEIQRNEVVVVNWEKIRSKDKVSGEWKNVVMKDGEKYNFRDVLKATREKRKVILIIDESHIGATAERTAELRDEVDADVVMEISATPKIRPSASDISKGVAAWIEVSASDVIEEGLIKKEIIINEDLDELSELEIDSQQAVLEKAFEKRQSLQNSFDKIGVDINPLVLIQIPNADAGEAKLNAVVDFLSSKEITENNLRLGIWLDGYTSASNLEGIAENTHPIQYLIFKQAIDTGWDCPRAHILIKFRESKSETFEIQVIGRILRMPEQKHYDIDELNNGYIFTNIHNIIVGKEEFNPNTIKHIKMDRLDHYENIELPSYYKSRADYGDITYSYTEIFIEEAKKYFQLSEEKFFNENVDLARKKGLELDVQRLRDATVLNVGVSTEKLDTLEGEINSSLTTNLILSTNDTQTLFNQFLESHMGTFTNVKRSIPVMKTAFYTFFKRFFGENKNRQDALWLQKVVLDSKNREHFSFILTNAIDRFAVTREEEIKRRVESGEQNYLFEVPERIYINEHVEEKVEHKKFVMNPCYLNIDRSNPERMFEKRLERDENIVWWFKNRTNKIEYFGVKYEYPLNRIKTFYPDYIVKYKDGTIGIYETKSDGDDENLGGLNLKNAKKAEALARWKRDTKRSDFKTGIVIVRGQQILINDKEVYDFESAIKGDWSDWSPF